MPATLAYVMLVSLDGYVATPDGGLEWQVISPEWHRFVNEQSTTAGALLFGRRMWELLEAFWPHADADETQPDYIRDYSRIWKARPKFVCSRSLEEVGWGAEILRSTDDVAALKQRVDGPILAGGPTLAADLIAAGLVDEYWLYVQPVALGAGRPYWPEGASERVDLQHVRIFDSGVVLLRYAQRR